MKKPNLISTGRHLPYNPALKERARTLRKQMTVPEKKIWHDYLRSFPYRVLRQRPIDNYIVDFYCSKLKLVIEIDGGGHYTVRGQKYDRHRDAVLRGYGLTVMRFSNSEVMDNVAGVIHLIEKFMREYPPL